MKEMRSMVVGGGGGGGWGHIFCVSQAAIKCILIVTNLCLHISNWFGLAKNTPEGLFQHQKPVVKHIQTRRLNHSKNDHCNVFSTRADVWHEANSFE